MNSTKHTIIAGVVALFWVLMFWAGVQYGISLKVEYLKDAIAAYEWSIADEKRKNAAFREVIEMERER